ncbi:MAG: glycosyltransferase family 4 protein [Nitrososphaeria archaeon]
MKILFLQPQPCIRSLKYAQALKRRLRNKISLVLGYTRRSLRPLYGYGDEFFRSTLHIDPTRRHHALRRILRKHKPDLIHSHNAPDFLTIAAIKTANGIPVIHDVHELLSLHNTGYYVGDGRDKLLRYRAEERRANEESDGCVFASEGIRRYIEAEYEINHKPLLVFPNLMSETMMPKQFPRKLSSVDGQVHIVYVGTVTSVKGSHYNFMEIFRKIARQRLHVHVYTTWEDDAYKTLEDGDGFLHYHGHVPRHQLLQEMTKYDLGWGGFNRARNRRHLRVALQNKLTEYIGCGLPVVTFPNTAVAEFVKKSGAGIIVENVDELAHGLRSGRINVRDLVETTLKTRKRLTIESKIDDLVNLYEEIVS